MDNINIKNESWDYEKSHSKRYIVVSPNFTIRELDKKYAKAISATPEMIDALITIKESAMWGKISQECRNKTLSALEKAGCEF